MPNPREVHVNVFIDNPDVRAPKFHFESHDLDVGPKNELTFTNDHHPGFNITFNLQPPTHSYLFPKPQDATDGVWSKFGNSECPQSQAREVFTEPRVSSSRESLTVHNRNRQDDTGLFGYTLRVTRDGGGTYLPLDPVGDNQNGPRS